MSTYEEVMKRVEECANTATPMPQYRSHKKVWALKIKEVVLTPPLTMVEHRAILVPEDPTYGPIPVSGEYMAKHAPEAGGYYVQYNDGYTSFSPAKAFEEGYSPV